MNPLKLSLLVSLLAASGYAAATKCPDGLDYSQHPDGNCSWYYQGTDPTRPTGAAGASATSASDASAGAAALAGVKSSIDNRVVVDASGAPVSNEQRQQQQQAQQQAQRLNNTNTAGGGVGTGGAGGNVTIQGNQAGSGDSYRYTAWVPMGLNVAASAVPSATTMPVVRRCDARVRIYSEAVTGYITGPLGGLREVTLGYRDKVGPLLSWDGNPEREPFELVNVYQKDAFGAFVLDRDGAPIIIEQRLMGTEVVGGMTVLSTSSGASLVGNLLVKDSGVAGGAGASAGLQQQGQVLNAFPCVYATRRVERISFNVTVTVRPRAPRPPRTVRPAAPKVKPCPVCCLPTAALVCPVPAPKQGA